MVGASLWKCGKMESLLQHIYPISSPPVPNPQRTMCPRQRIRLAVPTHSDTIQHLLIPISPLTKPFHLIPFRWQVHRWALRRRPSVPKDEIINFNLRQWTQQNNREQSQLRRQVRGFRDIHLLDRREPKPLHSNPPLHESAVS